MDSINDKLVFIIAHKYIRGYVSYLKYYIENIQLFYPKATIIVVDNNSVAANDVLETINGMDNIIILTNNIESKFELGAYQVGLEYLKSLEHKDFSYVICSQDTYILKNKFDFETLVEDNVFGASFIGWKNDLEKMDVMRPVLEKLGLFNNLELTNLCWCNSFIIDYIKIDELLSYLKQIVIKTRHESEASERYLGRLLFELNNGVNYSIDGSDNSFFVYGVRYNCLNVNPYDEIDKHFCKVAQQKNERTIET